jgi:hypothetical protein
VLHAASSICDREYARLEPQGVTCRPAPFADAARGKAAATPTMDDSLRGTIMVKE